MWNTAGGVLETIPNRSNCLQGQRKGLDLVKNGGWHFPAWFTQINYSLNLYCDTQLLQDMSNTPLPPLQDEGRQGNLPVASVERALRRHRRHRAPKLTDTGRTTMATMMLPAGMRVWLGHSIRR